VKAKHVNAWWQSLRHSIFAKITQFQQILDDLEQRGQFLVDDPSHPSGTGINPSWKQLIDSRPACSPL
jgi:hypothetical protein